MMKKLINLTAFVFLILIFLPKIANANSFYYTEHDAYAYTEYDDNLGNSDDMYTEDIQNSPPVFAEVGFYTSQYSGYASAYTFDGVNFYAESEASNFLSDPESYVYSEAWIDSILNFTADARIENIVQFLQKTHNKTYHFVTFFSFF